MRETLGNSEYRLLTMIWDMAPVASGALVAECQQQFGWKKSTTYTQLRRLIDRGLVQNEETIVSPLVPREEVECQESGLFVQNKFRGSLPGFVAAFLNGRTLSDEEARELQALIERHRE